MKLETETKYKAVFEGWTGDIEKGKRIQEAVKLLNDTFDDLNLGLNINSNNWVDKGFDMTIRININGEGKQ